MSLIKEQETQALTTKAVANLWGTTPAQVAVYGNTGRLLGAKKQNGKWIIPIDAVLVLTETITEKIPNYIDSLSDEEKNMLASEIAGNSEYIKYLGYLLERGYIKGIENLDIEKAKVPEKKPKKTITWVEVLDLISKFVVSVASAVAAIKGING
jgi:hypothetical protein